MITVPTWVILVVVSVLATGGCVGVFSSVITSPCLNSVHVRALGWSISAILAFPRPMAPGWRTAAIPASSKARPSPGTSSVRRGSLAIRRRAHRGSLPLPVLAPEGHHVLDQPPRRVDLQVLALTQDRGAVRGAHLEMRSGRPIRADEIG